MCSLFDSRGTLCHHCCLTLAAYFCCADHSLVLVKGLDPDAPIMLCRERVSAAVAAAADKEAGKKAESEERLKVFTEICNKDVAADILTRYVHGVVKVSRRFLPPSAFI